MININQKSDSFKVRIGDIITCRYDENLLIDIYDIVWTVRNSFTKETIFQTKDYMLKYRIDDNICFDIELSFYFKNRKYYILKESLLTSFII